MMKLYLLRFQHNCSIGAVVLLILLCVGHLGYHLLVDRDAGTAYFHGQLGHRIQYTWVLIYGIESRTNMDK